MSLSDTTLRRLTWASAVFIVVGALTSAILETLAGQPDEAFFSIFLLTFPAVGFVVVSRRPRATLGWLMVSMGFVAALPFTAYAHFALERDLLLGPLMFALGAPGWVPFIAISGYLLLLFPDGHLSSPRWRWFSWFCGIGMGLIAVFIWFSPGTFADDGYPQVVNPLGIAALKPIVNSLNFLTLFAPILVVGGAVALVVRFRRSTDDVVRHQIRWLAWAASWIALLFIVSFLPGAGDSGWNSLIQNLAALSFVLIPITIGIAVLRYRLYDIDIVIRKTVVIAVMIVAIAVVYVGVVAGVGALVGASSSPLLSALAAAIVALVFQPVRARARRFADRVVYGKRATPYEVMSTFGDQLAGTYAADDVLPRTARVLGEGVGAERAEVRMAFGEEMRAVAVWPPDPPNLPDDHVVEVRHQGDLLGALAVALPANDPIDPTREQLMQDLAAQAGLVLRNVRLTEELRARLDDLQAAQKRLVAAQDEERRRLERNIHDGAQQQLVALAVKARLVRQLLERDPAKAETMLDQMEARRRRRSRISAISPAGSTRRCWPTRVWPPRSRRRLANRPSPSGSRPRGSAASPRTSRPPSTSRCLEALAERREVRRGVGRHRGPVRTRVTRSGSGWPTTAEASTQPRPATAPACRGSRTVSVRSTVSCRSRVRPAAARP